MNKKYYTKTRGAYFLVLFLFITHIFTTSFSSAPPIGRTGAPGDGVCTSCHGGSNPQGLDGSVTITGLPAEVLPSTNYRVTVEVANPNGLSLRAGMQMVALNSQDQNAGSFANASPGAGVVVASNGRNYLGHSPAQNYDVDRIASYSVDWTSPADPDPTVTFYAVGNITDMDANSNTANDLILFETLDVAVAGDVMVDLPDLTADNIVGFNGTFAPGEVTEFNWDLINLGDAVAVDPYRVVMYLSDDTQFSPDDVVVGEVPTGNTFPGTISAVPGAITVPANQAEGDYYLIFFVDNDNVIEESDETNNLVTTTTTITVGVPVDLEAEIVATPDCDGAVTLESVVAGGELPYTYNWSTGETTADIVVTTTAGYAVTVTDGAQEQVVVAISATVPDVLVLNTTINQQPGGGQLGEIELSTSGGTAPFQILWSDGFTGFVNSGLMAGTFNITVTDANGCMSSTQVLLEEADGPLPDLTADNVVGFEGIVLPDDVVEFNWDLINLGQGIAVDNYRVVMYLSDDPQFSVDDVPVGEVPTGNTFPGTIPNVPGAIRVPVDQVDGEYYLIFFVDNDNVIEETDEANNIVSTTTVITVSTEVSDPLEVNINSTLDCSGFVTLESVAQGGVGALTYDWSTGETTADIVVTMSGAYAVTVTDDVQDQTIASVNIIVPDELVLNAVINQQPSDSQLGEIELFISGGTAPFDIIWSDGFTGTINSDLEAGTFVIMVTDANGCVNSIQVFLAEEDPTDLNITATVTQLTCPGVDEASISLMVDADVTYAWSTGATTNGISELPAGTYSVTVTTSTGNAEIRSFTITQLNPIEVISDVVSATCFGFMDGAINALATGGTGPYTYEYSNGAITNNISNLSGGDFGLTVTDANGCTAEFSFEVEEPEMLALGLSVIDVTCPSGTDGSIAVTQATGGTPPYSFSFSNGFMATSVINLEAGAYMVTLTDANGCEAIESVVVTEPAAISLGSQITMPPGLGTCIDISVAGLPLPLTFNWSNGEITEDICNLDPGTFAVTVTDGNGCETIDSFEVISTAVAGISELNSFEIYPTLADELLNVEVQLDRSVQLQIELVNLDGRYVAVPTASFSQIGLQQRATVDVSTLPSGMYLLILSTDQGREVKRFIKQ